MAARQILRPLMRRTYPTLTSSPSIRQPHLTPCTSRLLATTAPKQEAEAPAAATKDTEKPSGPVSGFMRGLVGGQTVAAEDAFIAEAKEQGVELPPPPNTQLMPLKRRKRREEEETGESARDRIFKRFGGSSFMNGVFEAKERIQERIEYSDNPVLNFFRRIGDRLFSENEMATVIREVREDLPEFRISEFLATVQEELVPEILGAYLHGDRKKLEEACTEEAFGMLRASIRERETEGIMMDTNILDVDDVELTAGKMMGESPVLIVTFTTQQINCLRNGGGEIIEGREDDIRAVYYAWAFVQDMEYEDEESVKGNEEGGKADGERKGSEKEHETKWKLMEMVIRGAHGTI